MANGYKINFTNNTITMNYTFAAAAAEYGTPEYNILKNIHKDFPEMKEVIRSGRKRRTPMKYKNLTYKNMYSYISSFEDSEELMDKFNVVRARSLVEPSPYKYVRDWFESQFPDYLSTQAFRKEEKSFYAA